MCIRDVKFSILSLLLLCSFGCSTPDDISNENRGIYGIVSDFATGEPVANANVQLRPTGETTLTGSDGRYEFKGIDKGDYSISVSKVEYTDLIDDYIITVDSTLQDRLFLCTLRD